MGDYLFFKIFHYLFLIWAGFTVSKGCFRIETNIILLFYIFYDFNNFFREIFLDKFHLQVTLLWIFGSGQNYNSSPSSVHRLNPPAYSRFVLKIFDILPRVYENNLMHTTQVHISSIQCTRKSPYAILYRCII